MTERRKSSRSGTFSGDCVEVAHLTGSIGVRDSKDPDGPELILDATDWRTLTRRIKDCEHDLS